MAAGALEQTVRSAKAELGALEAMEVQGAQEAMASGPCGRDLGPLGPATTRWNITTTP